MCPVLLVFSRVDMLGVGMAIGCVVAAREGTPGRAGNKATLLSQSSITIAGSLKELNLLAWYLRRSGSDRSRRTARS